MTQRKIRFVRFRYSHHSPHSGYSRIAEYGEKLLGSQTIPVNKPLSPLIIRERILWKLAKGTPGYTREAMAAELKVAQRALSERDCIYHFLYGETNYHYSGQDFCTKITEYCKLSEFEKIRHQNIMRTIAEEKFGYQEMVGKYNQLFDSR